MKFILTILIAFSSSLFLFSQAEYEPSPINPYGLPNPNAPAEIQDYQNMIGICDCFSTRRNQDGTWADSVNMVWEFKYIMNGLAVQDQTLKEDGAHAGSIRQYIADSSRWYVHYYSSAKPTLQLGTWQGGNKGEDIVLYKRQAAPNGMDGNYKITFHGINEHGFNWKGEWTSLDETIIYPTWRIRCKKRENN
ncbi:MAG: hypothetical protein P1U56_08165 [Saprospiraceae bacterium]|nr:hypothetical protein [Saprospiraceae bacterium]